LIKVVSVVSNDIVTDNRIHKIALSLEANGYQVTVVGRKLRKSEKRLNRQYKIRRFRLWFNKGPLFYLNLNIRLFFYLLFIDTRIILSNDLDTLLSCSMAARLSRKQLVFDSHELFPEVPELVHRPRVRKIWQMLEKKLVSKIKYGFTVSPSIAEFYFNTYGVRFEVIRNLGNFRFDYEFEGIEKPEDRKVIIYQGALNLGRGLEILIESMQHVNGAKLQIIGSGDVASKLKRLTKKLNLEDKVKFIGRLPHERLWKYTASASIGISIEENLGLNYQYALPNKLFDYIQARIPVIISDLPEMTNIVNKYNIGEVLVERTPQKLTQLIQGLMNEEVVKTKYSSNLELAARDLCWEKEEDKLIKLFKCASDPTWVDTYG
jgi:glycosyltransferase involved in cell wall biosynthesis